MPSILILVAGGTLVAAGAKVLIDEIQHHNAQRRSFGDILSQSSNLNGRHVSAEVASDRRSRSGRPKAGKRSTGNAIQRFKAQRVDPLFEDLRTQHLKEISLDAVVLSEEQQKANQQFVFSSILLVTTTASLIFYPPLILAHIPAYFFAGIPKYKKTYLDLVERRQVTTLTVDTALEIGTMIYAPFNLPILAFGATAFWSYSLANKIIANVKDSTRRQLTHLMGEEPQSVWILRDGVEVEVPFETVEIDDLLVLNAGEMIPVDGVIEEGTATIDQHMLTGEAQPIEKGGGEIVFAATMVMAGRIVLRVQKTGVETTVAQVGQMLVETADFTSSVELRGQEISDKAALPTLVLGAGSLPLLGPSQALAILVSGIGYNMRIIGPLSVLNFLKSVGYQGILIKDGRALEQIHQIDTVVFDKTGTLTLDQPHVGNLYPCDGYDETILLTYAAAAEYRQTHPIAKAILQAATERSLTGPPIDETAYEVGYGIKVHLEQQFIRVGSRRFMAMEEIVIPESLDNIAQQAHQQGYSLVYVAVNDQLAGVIELQPTVRPEAKHIIEGLKQRGLHLAIISGDHEGPTHALAKSLGIEQYFAETLPENKADLIARLQADGNKVCFVGDGINDSIALKMAQVSISLRGASTIATDTAQIILMDQTLNHLETLFDTAEAFEKNMSVNLMTTVVPGVIIIGGAFTGLVGYATSIPLFMVGLAAGVYNAMLPRLRAGQSLDQVSS